MIQNRIVCFRIDEHIDHRISRILGSRYFTRSRFIRTAIEYLLSHEEGQVRLHAAQMKIDWGLI
jgi:Arc/MetJ-type ribon-helix-helix transcriptional regulator